MSHGVTTNPKDMVELKDVNKKIEKETVSNKTNSFSDRMKNSAEGSDTVIKVKSAIPRRRLVIS